jgi:hypothetical protein
MRKVKIQFRERQPQMVIEEALKVSFDPQAQVLVVEEYGGRNLFIPRDAMAWWEWVEVKVLVAGRGRGN